MTQATRLSRPLADKHHAYFGVTAGMCTAEWECWGLGIAWVELGKM